MTKTMKKALSVFLVVVIMLTAAPLSGFVGLELPEWLDFSLEAEATTSNTTINISKDYEQQAKGTSFSVSASFSSDTYSPSAVTYTIEGESNGLTVDGGLSWVESELDDNLNIISYIVSLPLKAIKKGTYTVKLIAPDGTFDSIVIIVNEESSKENGTIVGYLEDYWEYILEEGYPTCVSEITVDGVSYDVSAYVLMTSKAEKLIGVKIVLIIENNIVVDVYEYSSLVTDLVVIPDNITLYYENGKFPDKKIDITGSIYNELNNKKVDASAVASDTALQLHDINVMLFSDNPDIIYFKDGIFSSKTNSTDFEIDSISAGFGVDFAQTAKVNTKWDFPVELTTYSFDMACVVSGSINGGSMSVTKIITVTLINNDYDIRNTWKTQSLEDLINQMESQVNICPVLTSGEKAQIGLTFTAIKMSQDLLKINDSLEALDCVYDLSCYVYGMKHATVNDAGKMLLETIQAECYNATDKLKTELANLLESLTETKEFNKFVYWYYNQQQIKNRHAKQVNAHCPIDITVTDEDGLTVLSIENDEVVIAEEGAAGFVCEGQKTIYLPTDINHSIAITATADGTMDYSICEYTVAGDERVIKYNDVSLVNGQHYTANIPRALSLSSSAYNLISSTGNEITSNFDSHCENAFDTGSCGKNLTWIYNKNTGTLTISGIGDMKDYLLSNRPWNNYEDNIKTVIIGDGVTTIGEDAFNGCDNLTSATIGDSVISIGEAAFYKCSSLTSVTIPNSVTTIGEMAFSNCTGLTSVKMPDSVISIGSCAFSNCKSLTSVTIPNSVTTIGEDAFYGCDNLTYVTMGDSVTSIGDNAFYKCSNLTEVYYLGNIKNWSEIDFQDEHANPLQNSGKLFINGSQLVESIYIDYNFTHIEDYAFYRCSSITEVTICNSNILVGSSAFCNCNNLNKVEISCNIPDYCFAWCESLYEVTLKEGVTQIGSCAFTYNSNIKRLQLPVSLYSIEEQAFGGDNIEEIYYNGNLNDWAQIIFSRSDSNPIGTKSLLYLNNELLTHAIFTEDITQINKHAFQGYANLVSITVPNNIIIGEDAFTCCSSLKTVYYLGDLSDWCKNNFSMIGESYDLYINNKLLIDINIPNDITTINKYAFAGCGSIESVSIPKTVSSIGQYAFYKCLNLESATILSEITRLDSFTFHESGLNEIVLPRTVEYIGWWAFPYRGLDIFYSGTNNEWNTLINNSSSVGYVEDYTRIHYKSTYNHYMIDEIFKNANSCEITYRCTCGYEKKEYIDVNSIVSNEGIIVTPKDQNTISVNTILHVSLLETTNVSIIYDITLTSDGVEVQPNGSVTVKLPVPEGVDGNLVSVYRCETDGTYTNMNAIYKNGYMVFTTDHFSKYMMVLDDSTEFFSIQAPSRTEIRHKDGIKLHANIEGTAPAGSYVVWTASNDKFKTEEINNGNSLKIVSDKNGTTTFTATFYSADGEVLATDSIEMKSKAGFFDKIGSFFRSLFGGTKIYEN